MAKDTRGGKYKKKLSNGKEVELVYGDEYKTLLEIKELNVKIIQGKLEKNATAPQDTATPFRIYVITENNKENSKLKSFIFYDKDGKKYKQIDKDDHYVEGKKENPHTHYGYYHNENGDGNVTKRDLKLIEQIEKAWYNHLNK